MDLDLDGEWMENHDERMDGWMDGYGRLRLSKRLSFQTQSLIKLSPPRDENNEHSRNLPGCKLCVYEFQVDFIA